MNLLKDNLDTSVAAEELQYKLLAGLSAEERFQRMNRLCAFGKMIMLEGLRKTNQGLSERELLVLLARNLWGRQFAEHIEKKLGNVGEKCI